MVPRTLNDHDMCRNSQTCNHKHSNLTANTTYFCTRDGIAVSAIFAISVSSHRCYVMATLVNVLANEATTAMYQKQLSFHRSLSVTSDMY